MADDPMIDSYEAEAVRSAFRFAVRAAAADGITKAAGPGYSRRLAEYAQAWMPLASSIYENARRMDEHLEMVRRLYDKHEARKSARAQMPSQARPPEPQLMPVDLEQMRLDAAFGPAGEPRGSTVTKGASDGRGSRSSSRLRLHAA